MLNHKFISFFYQLYILYIGVTLKATNNQSLLFYWFVCFVKDEMQIKKDSTKWTIVYFSCIWVTGFKIFERIKVTNKKEI